MSQTGKRIINRFPEHSRIHDPENAMNGLLDNAVGEWFDRLEAELYSLMEKRKIITNISDESDPTSEDYLLSRYFLDIQGEEYGLTRKENETNREYRARILSIRKNNISIEGIALIVASILNIPIEEVEIINNRDALRIGDKIHNRISGEKHKPVFNRLVKTRGIIFIKVHEIDDPEFLLEVLKNCTLAFVEIILLYSRLLLAPENPSFANVGDDVDFGVILLDQDNQILADKNIVFYNNESVLGSRNTGEDGKSKITLKNIKKGVYDLKGRYNKTYSSVHRLVVKYGLKLTLEGATSVDNGEYLRYIVTATNQNGNLVEGLTINWYVDGELVNSCITNETGRCMYCFTAKGEGIHEIYVQVVENKDYHDTLSNKIYLDVYGAVEIERTDCVVDFYLHTGRTIPELEEVKETAMSINLYGEKWIPWEFPLEEVLEYFNNDFSNIQFFIGTKRLKHLFINKKDYQYFLLEIPYYKIETERIPIKAIIYADKEKRTYYNQKDLSKNYYDFANGLPNDYIGSETNHIESDENEIILSMDEQGIFRADPVEYRDILTVEKVKQVENSYKSLVGDENLNDDRLPNYALTVGRDDNDTGLFITPIPNPDLNDTLGDNERFTPLEDSYVLTRQLMNNKEKYVKYYASLPNISNIAEKENYQYYLGSWLKYIGKFNIALIIVMQNIIQAKYKTLMIDEDYEISYPQKFEHYDLEGLTNINIVKQTTAPVLSDISIVGGYYQSISHTQTNTGYNNTQETGATITLKAGYPSSNPESLPWTSIVNQFTVPIPSGASFAGGTITVWLTGNGQVAIGMGGVTNQIVSVNNNTSSGTQFDVWNGGSYGNIIVTNLSGSCTIWACNLTPVWNKSTPYTYYTYYTNALFKSGKIKIDSDKAELVIENNQRPINSIKGYLANDNSLKGTLLNNQNVKNVAIDDWAGKEYLIELDYKSSGTSSAATFNLFTDLFLKNIYNDIKLEDISYEITMICKHGLDQNQVNSIITLDNNNKNIYRRALSITNFPVLDDKLVRADKKNIRFTLKDQKVLLNHNITNDGFIIELPDRYLTANKNDIAALIMPLDYEYESMILASYLPILYLNEIEYVLPP